MKTVLSRVRQVTQSASMKMIPQLSTTPSMVSLRTITLIQSSVILYSNPLKLPDDVGKAAIHLR